MQFFQEQVLEQGQAPPTSQLQRVQGQLDFMSVSWSSTAVTVYQNGVQVFTTSGEDASSGASGTGIGLPGRISSGFL